MGSIIRNTDQVSYKITQSLSWGGRVFDDGGRVNEGKLNALAHQYLDVGS